MKKIFFLLFVIPLLISCSSQRTKEPHVKGYEKNTHAFDILIGQFAHNIEYIWGRNEVLFAGPKDYVKYSDQYQTRSHIDFENGVIVVETLDYDAKFQLKQAIEKLLLMGDDANFDADELYSDANDIKVSYTPFLLGQVLDQQGKPIKTLWSARVFSDYLINNKLVQRRSGNNVIWSITINLVSNHMDQRAHKYLPLIRQASRKYGVELPLILAIMQVESSFNPYAVSSSDALGLMQVMQKTAGYDVFQQQGKSGYPSRHYLFDPESNIDTGAAYLALLQNNYLAGINNPVARRYAMIAAYNGGAGNVLRMFSADKDLAFRKINRLSPDELYKTLINYHPAEQTQRYLQKVTLALKTYYRME